MLVVVCMYVCQYYGSFSRYQNGTALVVPSEDLSRTTRCGGCNPVIRDTVRNGSAGCQSSLWGPSLSIFLHPAAEDCFVASTYPWTKSDAVQCIVVECSCHSYSNATSLDAYHAPYPRDRLRYRQLLVETTGGPIPMIPRGAVPPRVF